MNKYRLRCICLWGAIFAAALTAAQAADGPPLAEVARRGAEVMPFDLKATTHVFSKTARGGTQRVVARNPRDSVQTRLVRGHLRDLQQQFKKADFSGPAHIHGADMPGLAELERAKPGAISVADREAAGGAELTYRTRDIRLVAALHRWLDAQLSEQGADAMQGHRHNHGTH